MDNEKRYEAKTDSEWLANIYEMLAESDDLSLDEVKGAIRDEGGDPEALFKRGMAFIEQQRQLATKRMLEEAKGKKKAALKIIEPGTGEIFSGKRLKDKVREAWANLSEPTSGKLQLAYRNLDTLTDQDLNSLLGDLERLAKLSEEGKEDGTDS